MKLGISTKDYSSLKANIKPRSGKVLWFFARHAFLFIVMGILVSVLIGEFLFYRYIYLAQTRTPDMASLPTRFKENIYQSVLSTWEEKEKEFRNATPQGYDDPFH